MILRKIWFGFFLYFFSSCEEDWLGTKANKQQAVPASLKDFQAILNNEEVLNLEYSSALAEIASDGHFTTESEWASTSREMSLNAYTWSNSRPYDNFNWVIAFKRVFSSNIVLDGCETLNASDDREQLILDNVKGQALFHRADAFYRVSQVWAPPYSPETADADLGVPLRLEADVTLPSVRSSLSTTYDQIIEDLLEASKLLPVDFLAKTRPYRLSAFGLLARIYLSMREYEKAGAYADSSLRIYNTLMDFNTLSPSTNFIGNANDNPEVIFHMLYYTTSFLTSACFIDSTLYSLYDENDLRKAVFFRENVDGSISFTGNYNDNTFTLFSGLATDELYLIRAESYARSGQTALAMKDMNDLLRTRWKKIDGVTTYVDQIAVDSNDALTKILIEREKELLMRGLRWSDLRRLNFESSFKKTLSRSIGGNTYRLEPGSYRYTFPIPNDIISRSNMQQNIGW